SPRSGPRPVTWPSSPTAMSSGSSQRAGSTWRRRTAGSSPWTRPVSASSATSTPGRSSPAGTRRRPMPTRGTTMTSHFEEQQNLGPLASAVRRRLKEFDADDVVSRIWSHDHTVWKPDPTEITNRLGWLTLATDLRPRIPELQAFARQVAADGFTHAVLLGMGGSSLAPEMFARIFAEPHRRAELKGGTAPGALELTVLDTTHPATIARVEASLPLDHT